MTASGQSPSERKVKTVAIRLDPELHEQLGVIAQLRGNSITDEIREALSAHVAAQGSSEELAESAAGLLDDIEREAAARRDALSTLFEPSKRPAKKTSRRSSGGKRGSTEGEAG